MNLYEINQKAYSALPQLSDKELKKTKKIVQDFLDQNSDYKRKNNYFSLLNHNQRYLTLFNCKQNYESRKNLVSELYNIIQELGIVKSVELSSNSDHIEFWITLSNNDNSECEAFMFCNYNLGVLEV